MNQNPIRQQLLRIRLRVNNRCQFTCSLCQGKSTAGVCTDYVLDDILDALAFYAPLQIWWCGGEPLLSPRLAEYIARTADQGTTNFVCTNMIPSDPLGTLAGRFVYQVEVHGVDPTDFKQHTGWNLFGDFQRHFSGLFETGHLVDAGMAISVDWREYLEPRISWLNNYPIRSLRIFDDWESSGSTVFSHCSIQASDIAEMKQRIADITPNFPVVYPVADKKNTARNLFISPVTDGSAFCEINGIKVENRNAFLQMLERWNNSKEFGGGS